MIVTNRAKLVVLESEGMKRFVLADALVAGCLLVSVRASHGFDEHVEVG